MLKNKNPLKIYISVDMEGITDVIKVAGAESLIFGLDFPWNEKERTHQDIKRIKSLDVSEDDKAKILGGNLAKLLGINID